MSTPSPADPARRPVTLADVYRTWWPLAASWLMMGLELPAVSAVMARLPQPTVSLAAYGGVVFPLALLIEAPIIMMLSASTALSRDWPSYLLLRRAMVTMGGALTVLHAAIAFTPLYDVVVARVLGIPADILEPARLGLQIMTPWTMSIAYRRTQQGVLIRYGNSYAVGVGTAVRLGANVVVLALGYLHGGLPGIAVGTAAVIAGVLGEALYAGLAAHRVLRDHVRPARAAGEPLTVRRFVRFYTPLALTPLIGFFAMPLASAAMTRMPLTIASLAAWPVVNGLAFTLRSVGFAFNEVVVSLLDRPGAVAPLRRFAFGLAGATSALLLLVAASPLGPLWFGDVSGLTPDLTALAVVALAISFPLPGLNALQSWYQGILVHAHLTRGVSESMAVYLAVTAGVLAGGIALGRLPGLYITMLAMGLAGACQVAWLRYRARDHLRVLAAADSGRR